MVKHLKKYALLYLFVYLTVWLSLASTPLNEPFKFSHRANQIFSLLTYLPFGVLVLWKLVGDLRKPGKNLFNLVYYLLGFYYVGLSAYRLFNGMEVKETLYYSVVLFGSVAACLQIRDGRWAMSAEDMKANFMGILVYMIVYKILFTLLSVDLFGYSKVLGNPPINNLYSTSMLAMLLPFLADRIRDKAGKRGWFHELLMCLSLMLIMICKSRMIFTLGLCVFAGLLLVNLRSKAFLRLLSVGLCAVLVVGVLAVADVAEVRESVNRATSLFPDSDKQSHSSRPNRDPDKEKDEEQDKMEAQIQQSDNMRADLMKLALVEVRKAPVFGTGDLYYTYQMTYKTMEQTAHNFILESLVSYGIVGTAMIAVLLLSLLISSGFFAWKKLTCWRSRAGAFGMLLYFFALGMVQPSVYNTLLCPLFAVLIEYYHGVFSTAEAK
jgi:hypothetical protein